MDHIVRRAATMGLVHSYGSPQRPQLGMQVGGPGQLLLSRHRIRRARWQYFNTQAWFEVPLCSRGALYVELGLPDGERLDLGVVHNTSGFDVLVEGMNLVDTPLYQGVNVEGLAQLLEWVDLGRKFVSDGGGAGSAAGRGAGSPSSAHQPAQAEQQRDEEQADAEASADMDGERARGHQSSRSIPKRWASE